MSHSLSLRSCGLSAHQQGARFKSEQKNKKGPFSLFVVPHTAVSQGRGGGKKRPFF